MGISVSSLHWLPFLLLSGLTHPNQCYLISRMLDAVRFHVSLWVYRVSFYSTSHTHTHTIHLLTVLHKSNVNFQFSFRRMSKGETFLFPILTGKVKHNRRNKSDSTKTTREKKIPCFECVSHLFYDYYDLSVEWIERSSIKKQNIGGRFWWFEHSYV